MNYRWKGRQFEFITLLNCLSHAHIKDCVHSLKHSHDENKTNFIICIRIIYVFFITSKIDIVCDVDTKHHELLDDMKASSQSFLWGGMIY